MRHLLFHLVFCRWRYTSPVPPFQSIVRPRCPSTEPYVSRLTFPWARHAVRIRLPRPLRGTGVDAARAARIRSSRPEAGSLLGSCETSLPPKARLRMAWRSRAAREHAAAN